MNVKKVFLLSVVFVIANSLSAGVDLQQITRVKPAPLSPFLEQQELLVKQKASFPFHYFYLKKDAGEYKNVYVAPVNTRYLRENKYWAKLDEKMAKQLGTDIEKIAAYTQQTFKEEFAKASGTKKLQVVDSPDRKQTLVVELAIIKIVPSKAELNILGTAGNVFLPGVGIITQQIAGGTVTIECMIRDSETKQIIAMYANTEKDQHALVPLAGMTWYTSAEKNIQKQAVNTAKVFSGTDYSSTRRRIIKLIEF